MRSPRNNIFCILGLVSVGLAACGNSSGGGSAGRGGAPGSGGAGSGGSPGSGGTVASGSGGSVGSGGKGSGGVVGSGGTTVTGSGGNGTGGSPGSGGAGTGGSPGAGGTTGKGGTTGQNGGVTGSGGEGAGGAPGAGGAGRDAGPAMGGRTGQGGTSSPGGATGQGGSTATGTGAGGSTGSDSCVKGQLKGTNVAVCGESFIAMTHGLTKDIEALATAAGSLKSGEHYDDESISGTWMSSGSGSIPDQYKTAQGKNDIKYVVMDGGGNDCMNGGTGDPIITAATKLFQQMATDGVLKVVYFWMPDPVGSSWANLKSCLDAVRPKIKSLCEGLTSPKCYYVDLRESWNGHPEYTSDGIHPTAAGDTASSKQIWDVMVKNCVAQ